MGRYKQEKCYEAEDTCDILMELHVVTKTGISDKEEYHKSTTSSSPGTSPLTSKRQKQVVAKLLRQYVNIIRRGYGVISYYNLSRYRWQKESYYITESIHRR